MEIKQDMDFNDLRNNCWGQATQILEEISNADKEDDLMYYLEEIYGDEIPTLTEINDILAYDWEQVYDDIGMSDENEDDDDWEEDDEITNSRKSIKSGITYEQALDMFTSEGKPWGDYWSMQADWMAFVDYLERDGEVDYEEARWWDNPCTPETFNEWVGRSNDDEYDEYYDDDE